MISESKVWMFSNNSENKTLDESTKGKWLVKGSLKYFEKTFPKIDYLVEQGKIYAAKYTHKKNINEEMLPFNKPEMCVYADDKTKEKTLEELLNLGIKKAEWKYNSETRKDWQPGGKLYKESERQRLEYFLMKY